MAEVWTENQWYSFLCGFQAGMKLQNLSLPDMDNSVTLFPIPVGGSGNIGIAMPKLLYDGVTNSGVIPVYTHDVDIPYGAFSVSIKWDDELLKFDGVTQGDFGTIGNEESTAQIRYSYSNGVFKARGIREDQVNFQEQIILFYINVTVITPIKSDIYLKFDNGNGQNLDKTSLMSWVYDEFSGEYNTYFITPTVNVNGAIIVDGKGDSNESTVGDDNSIGAPSSPTGIYIGSAFTPPGRKGVVPIYSNSNVKDNFPYKEIGLKVEIVDTNNIIEYMTVVGADGFNITVTSSTSPNGNVVLDIVAKRDIAAIDSITFCYIMYTVKASASDNFNIPLNYISGYLN